MMGLTLQWASSPATPGANDNASAVASMLTCAEALLASKPADVELMLVGTGAEEVGCRGMHSFVDGRLDWSPSETFFVNFECTGGGKLHYIRSEGVLTKFGYPAALLDHARRLTADGDYADITPTDLLAATDGHVPAHHGFPTLSLISLEANGVPRNYHRPEDTVEALDLAMVVRAADFGAKVAAAAVL
jgi:Zn-dependent M28 family amino/carboxypeptidase